MAGPNTPPNVLLYIATGCAICPIVHRHLSELQTLGKIAQLEVIDISEQPELASHQGIRSVPWFRIGDLEFQGLHSASELAYWAGHAQSEDGIRKYISDELEAGHLPLIEQLVRAHPEWLRISLAITADMDAPIQARIGLGAIFEGLQGDPLLKSLVPALTELSRHGDRRVRGDACYYLGLSAANNARPALTTALADPDPDVREIAQDALQSIPN